MLADGDILTFGKAVGRDEYLVRPVIVRVQLIYGPAVPSPPVVERNISAMTNEVPAEVEQGPKSATRSGTGRYGVYSSSSDSSLSEHESDVDEPEEPGAYTTQYRPVLPMRSGRLALLRRVLPPYPRYPARRPGAAHTGLTARLLNGGTTSEQWGEQPERHQQHEPWERAGYCRGLAVVAHGNLAAFTSPICRLRGPATL